MKLRAELAAETARLREITYCEGCERNGLPLNGSGYCADCIEAARRSANLTLVTVRHCQQCGNHDYESTMTGDQGYSACCNEPVVSGCDESCGH